VVAVVVLVEDAAVAPTVVGSMTSKVCLILINARAPCTKFLSTGKKMTF